jgi:catechol 2,3-dioxygenase-like lactoylglutathione lyase family enzyme
MSANAKARIPPHQRRGTDAMINGAHVMLYSRDADADRAFLRDMLGFAGVDVGDGWLILRLPPAEIGVHPTDGESTHELYLMCDDLVVTLDELAAKGVKTSGVPADRGWGCAGINRHGEGDESALHRRSSDPRWPRVMRRRPRGRRRSVDRGTCRPGYRAA